MTVGSVAFSFALAAANAAGECDCRWTGSFTSVARRSPVVVRAVVRRHGGTTRVGPRHMDLEIVQTLKGTLDGRRITVAGGDGMLCRPEVSRFPVGSEWVLALEGPKGTPGREEAWALPVCGTCWLEVRGGEVVGNFDDDLDQATVQILPVSDFAPRLAASLAGPGRTVEHFVGEATAGQVFRRAFGGGFEIRLEPVQHGWLLRIGEQGRDEDLSRLTPPLHFAPNPREIEGWHLRNADNSGPNEAGEKNTNAPGTVRRFIFSPEVGVSIDPPAAARQVTPTEIDLVEKYGQGRLEILDHRLTDLELGELASFAWIRFSVDLSYPAPLAAPPRER